MGGCQPTMGCCHHKDVYVVCSCELDGGNQSSVWAHLHESGELTFHVNDPPSAGAARSPPLAASSTARTASPPNSPKKPFLAPEHDEENAPRTAKVLGAEETTPTTAQVPAAEEECRHPVEPDLPPKESNAEAEMLLLEPLHLTGNFANWSTSFPQARLQPVRSTSADVARLKLCVKMTSMSFSFQVVSSQRQWNWRLYPRDAKPLKWAHVSKEGRLRPEVPDAVVVGLGDNSRGHGLNFHVVEEEPTTVTIWIEVPVVKTGEGLALQTESITGARVWYTREDTGVQFTGGDGVDLNKYKWMKPAGW